MSETSAIDEKKEEINGETQEDSKNYVSFFINTLALCGIFVAYFILSGSLLYGCKLAQSNILPTDIKCFPYTDSKPDIEKIQTDIFTDSFINSKNAMKLSFPFDSFNEKNKLLEMFKNYKEETDSNFLANYFINILETLINFNYTIFNMVLNGMNQLPEPLIVLFGIPMFSFISAFIIFICNSFYFIYLWFVNMGWFFKQNINISGTGNPKWEEITWKSLFTFSFYKYWISIGLVILFACLLIFVGFGFIPFISMFLFFNLILTCLTYKSKLNGEESSVFTIIQNVFKNYKITIMWIFSLIVISGAFNNLGTGPGIFSLITLGLIYFGMIGIQMFKPPENDKILSPIGNYQQAVKTCISKSKNFSDVNSSFFGMFGGGEKKFKKQLKDIYKNHSSKQ
jgi:hypothetical protein